MIDALKLVLLLVLWLIALVAQMAIRLCALVYDCAEAFVNHPTNRNPL